MINITDNANKNLIQFVTVIVISLAVALLWDGFTRLPESTIIPLREWVTVFFKWLRSDQASFFDLFTVKEVTRSISWLLKFPLKWSEYIFFRGFRVFDLPAIPWVVLLLGTTILGHWIGGKKLALLCFFSLLYLSVFGLWKDSMKTLAVIIVAMMFAAVLGVIMGIWITRSKRAEAFFTPMLDIMQATPHMAYLAPVFALFGAGQTAALIATVIFAMPPMTRCTVLGIKTVPDSVIEAGRMAGCTKFQLLWRVEIPAAHRLLVLGLNQVVMQTLAMVVIMSIVGAQGLGQKLLFSLQQLRLGAAIEQGVAIVLLAVVLDRLTQAYANRTQPSHYDHMRGFVQKHKHMIIFAVLSLVVVFAIMIFPELKFLKILPKKMTHTFGRELDFIVKSIVKSLYFIIDPIRDFVTVYILIPIRDFYIWAPWTLFLGIVGYGGYKLGGVKLAFLTSVLLLTIVFSGFWEPAIMTFYTVSIATIFCILIGIPIGVMATKSERASKIILSSCDLLQTFPSFIYLLPAVMLLRVGDLAVIMAIIPYAVVPAIRYTYLGIKRIPEVIIEASIANGATKKQILWKVELPVAISEIMLGINQTIMMALAMTAITALIGTTDLGQEIYRALAYQEYGRGILAGLWIAMIGIIADRLIGAWAKKRKENLGL